MERQKTMNDFFDSDIAQAGGWTSVALSITFSLINIIGELPINEILQFLVTLGGFVFLIYKIKGQHLDNQLKKQQLKEEQNEEKE